MEEQEIKTFNAPEIHESEPTTKTVGQLGDLYYYKYQSSKYTYSMAVYILASITYDEITYPIENMQVYYNWQRIVADRDLASLRNSEKLFLENFDESYEFEKSINDSIKKLQTDINALKTEILAVPALELKNNCDMRLTHLGTLTTLNLKLPDKVPLIFQGTITFRTRTTCTLKPNKIKFYGNVQKINDEYKVNQGLYILKFRNISLKENESEIICSVTRISD